MAEEVGGGVAAADREVTAAGAASGLQDRTVVARFAEFVRGGQVSDAAADDDHLGGAAAGEGEVARLRGAEGLFALGGFGRGREAEGTHGGEHGARATRETHVAQEGTAKLVPGPL